MPVSWHAGNILSHLGPVILLLLAIVSGVLPAWTAYPVAFYGSLVPILLCLSGSVVYHTLMANHPNYQTWITMDVRAPPCVASPPCSPYTFLAISPAPLLCLPRVKEWGEGVMPSPRVQVCGIFALFLCGVHVLLWWGLRCFPLIRALYTAAYYALAAAAVLISTRTTNVVWRAAPMLALCLVGAKASYYHPLIACTTDRPLSQLPMSHMGCAHILLVLLCARHFHVASLGGGKRAKKSLCSEILCGGDAVAAGYYRHALASFSWQPHSNPILCFDGGDCPAPNVWNGLRKGGILVMSRGCW